MPSDDFDEKLSLGKVNAEVLKRSVLSLMPTQSKINLDAYCRGPQPVHRGTP